MIKYKLLSSLSKVFSTREVSDDEINKISLLKNETASFQIVLNSDKDETVNLNIFANGLTFDLFRVNEVPVGKTSFDGADDYFIDKQSMDYPDILMPITDKVELIGGTNVSVWVQIKADESFYGKSEIEITVGDDKVTLDCEIINVNLCEQKLIYTNWYHCDGICHYYGVTPFGKAFWEINKEFIAMAVENGMNCILTPLFTPPLDTAVGGERLTTQLVDVSLGACGYTFDFSKLSQWIELCLSLGIKYFEMSHFFTQWGALHAPKIIVKLPNGELKRLFGWDTPTDSEAYYEFLEAFSKELIPFLEKKGISKNVFLHVSDEPGEKDLDVYKGRADFLKRIFPGFKFIDALSDFEFYKTGAVEQPIPCEDNIEAFYGNVPELWTYYCCGQQRKNVPNRFIAMPSARNRILGILLYKYNVKGFLQWGYNFYNSQYSIKQINPFEVTDAGNAFPAGDAFVVYPGENGKPLSSLRLKVFNDGLQDMRALETLEKFEGRNKVLEILDDITFTSYPQGDDFILNIRKVVNERLKKYVD